MRLSVICAVVFCSVAALANATVSYKGHLVVRATPSTEHQVNFLKTLDARNDAFDFWTHPRGVGFPVDIHIAPENYRNLAKTLWRMNIRHKIKTTDLEAEITKERQLITARRYQQKDAKAFDFHNYHPFETVQSYLQELSTTNAMVSVASVGKTHEGRDVWLATVSTGSDPNKPIIQMDCNIHAREWITAASCLWFINQLTTGYGVDADTTSLLDAYDWAIIPISNPDGYHHTWTTDRLWRKNRAPTNSILGCVGVDANRNFDANFGGQGSSSSACSDTYHGVAAFSEAESTAIKNALLANGARVRASLSIHSYSQLWMSPYSYTYTLPPQYSEMLSVMTTAVQALEATYNTQYQYGNGADTIYVAAGTTVDWAYEGAGVVHSYTIELRDTGDYGFELPPTQIEPTANETWNGIKAMAFALLQLKH